MNKEELTKTRQELLERIRDGLQEELIPAEIRSIDEKTPLQVLSVYFDELGFDSDGVYGDFYFLPVTSEDQKVQHFSALMTIADEIPADSLPALYEAMSYINTKVPCGCFCIDKDKSFLAYRLSAPLPVDMDKEQLFNEINVVMGNAVVATDMFMDLLLRLMDGNATITDVTDSLA